MTGSPAIDDEIRRLERRFALCGAIFAALIPLSWLALMFLRGEW